LTAENASDLELSSHHRVVTSAVNTTTVAPVVTCEPTMTTPSSLSATSTPPLPRTEESQPEDFMLGRSSTKRGTASTPSFSSIGNFSNAPPHPEKVKATEASSLNASGMHSDVKIMEIDDIEDPCDEPLNKTNHMADIKHFFTPIPCLPGAKPHVKCNLCM